MVIFTALAGYLGYEALRGGRGGGFDPNTYGNQTMSRDPKADSQWRAMGLRAPSEFENPGDFYNQEGFYDEFGFTDVLPGHRTALDAQFGADRVAARRNDALMRDAMGRARGNFADSQAFMRTGLESAATYRPGGTASQLSGYYSGMAQSEQNLAGLDINVAAQRRQQAPDLMARYREQRASAAREAAQEGQLTQILGGLAGAGIGALAGPLGAGIGGQVGGAAGAAAGPAPGGAPVAGASMGGGPGVGFSSQVIGPSAGGAPITGYAAPIGPGAGPAGNPLGGAVMVPSGGGGGGGGGVGPMMPAGGGGGGGGGPAAGGGGGGGGGGGAAAPSFPGGALAAPAAIGAAGNMAEQQGTGPASTATLGGTPDLGQLMQMADASIWKSVAREEPFHAPSGKAWMRDMEALRESDMAFRSRLDEIYGGSQMAGVV